MWCFVFVRKGYFLFEQGNEEGIFFSVLQRYLPFTEYLMRSTVLNTLYAFVSILNNDPLNLVVFYRHLTEK